MESLSGEKPFVPLGFGLRDQSRKKRWLIGLLAALLFHLLLLSRNVEWLGNPRPPPVEIEQIDMKKLDAIRKQWSRQSQNLLIDKGQTASKEAPKDARYFSDRNIRVEKETRAKEHTLLPKPGSLQVGGQNQPKVQAKPREAIPEPHAFPNLGNLGVPLPVPRRDETEPQVNATDQEHPPGSTQVGGEQYIKDENLPEGAENMLNAQESVFYSFYARLYEAIAPIWQSKIREIPRQKRIIEGDYSTQVDVVLDSDGNLIGVRRMKSSGVPEFDSAVDDAWKRISRFPNPPSQLLNERGEVHTGWTFTVEVGSGWGLRDLPPERNY